MLHPVRKEIASTQKHPLTCDFYRSTPPSHLPLFQIVYLFGKSRCIDFAMYLDRHIAKFTYLDLPKESTQLEMEGVY